MTIGKIFTGVLLVFTLSLNAQPQHKQGQRQGPPPIPNDEQIEKMVDEMAEKLQLTEDQKAKLLILHKEHFAEVKIKREAQKQQRAGDREEMETLRTAFETKVKAELSDEQVKAFDEFRKNRQLQQRKQWGKGQRPG